MNTNTNSTSSSQMGSHARQPVPADFFGRVGAAFSHQVADKTNTPAEKLGTLSGVQHSKGPRHGSRRDIFQPLAKVAPKVIFAGQNDIAAGQG